MKKTKLIENVARTLTIVSFIAMCWVIHRTLQVRSQCVSSSFISFVQIGGDRVENCLYESRLSLRALLHPLPESHAALVRKLEVLENLSDLFPVIRPRVAVDVSLDQPRLYESGTGFVRLGSEWLDDKVQTQRALIMAVLKRDQARNYANAFQLETMTDFLMLTVMAEKEWKDYSETEVVKFSTSSPSFSDYCRSPFRSLAHYESCLLPSPEPSDLQANVWGFRPLLAVALWRIFEKAPLAQKMRTMQAIRFGEPLPQLQALRGSSIEDMIRWFQTALQEHLTSLRYAADEHLAWSVKSTLKELEVEAPTHWELTVDITNTPAWKEILAQFKTWSRFHRGERTLIFTPEGAIALPADLPVAWRQRDIRSQKHVMIACQWPKPADVVAVTARHVYARQSCGKVDEVFWN